MEFIKMCLEYLNQHRTLAMVLATAAILLIAVIVALIVVGAKRSKKKKSAKANAQAVASTEQATSTQPAPAPAAAEKTDAEREALRQATLARLEAERLAVEKEDAELALAQAQQTQAEEKAAKSTAKKTTNAKTKSVQTATNEKPRVKKSATTQAQKPTQEKAKAQETVQAPTIDVADEADETEKAAKYNGKWSIFRVLTTDGEKPEEEMYFFELRASNGEKLLSSEEYTSYTGAVRGIATHKTNIEKGNFKISLSKKGDYIFKLLSGKNMLLCMGENYPTRARCESAIESTKRFAKTAVVDENIQDHLVKIPVEDDAESNTSPLPEGYNGKWMIESTHGADGEVLYYFILLANNGEKLLSSEEYTTYVGAVNGIATHKANIEKGNFRITLTKRGDYIYKLLNGNGQLLCLGEHYKTKRLCQNAVESVKRFAKNSPVLTDPQQTK